MPQIGEIKKGKEIGHRSNNGQTKYIRHACVDCGKERWVILWKTKRPQFTGLCHRCSLKGRNLSGKKNSHWKGGRNKSTGGYIEIWLSPDDFFYSMARKVGYVLEHRLVVAQALGRCLHSWEIVHHKGTKYPKGSMENRQDNRYPENLQLVTDDRHKQISILERRISYLEKENTELRRQLEELNMQNKITVSA